MYFLREAIRNFGRHRRTNTVAVLVIAISMLMVSGVALSYVNFQQLATYWGSDVRVVLYLRDEISAERREALERTLSAAPETASLEYTSKEQALAQFQARLGEGANILQGLQANPLPASFTLKVRDEVRQPDLLRQLADRYQTLPEIEEIDYGARWVERFHSMVWTLELGLIGVGVVIGIAVMFIIATTVRLALYARAEEIEIMRLVGATPWFIKIPFLFEGVLQGLLGTSLAVVLLYGLFSLFLAWAQPIVEVFFDLSLFQFLSPPATAAIILGGACLGALGSIFSLRRSIA
jgi:cell division transport system permease protein